MLYLMSNSFRIDVSYVEFYKKKKRNLKMYNVEFSDDVIQTKEFFIQDKENEI